MEKHKKNHSTLILLNVIAGLLLSTWLMPATRHFWDIIDAKVFYFLNGWVATNHVAQIFWAITNYRPFDIIPFLFLLSTCCIADFFIPKAQLKSACILLFFTMILLLILRIIMYKLFGVHRASASLSLAPAYLLKALVPYIQSKDASSHSFPGDHAAVIFVWIGFMWIFAKNNYYRLLAIIIGSFFILPRLVAGAHWFSDDFVGGLFVAIIAIAWTCFTPLTNLIIEKTLPILNFCLNKLVPRAILTRTFERG